MEDKSIKVKIGNREYPLSIEDGDEAKVAKAAKLINDNINNLKNNYAVSDAIDLLAMTALEFTTKYLENNSTQTTDSVHSTDNSDVVEKLKAIDEKLAEALV